MAETFTGRGKRRSLRLCVVGRRALALHLSSHNVSSVKRAIVWSSKRGVDIKVHDRGIDEVENGRAAKICAP